MNQPVRVRFAPSPTGFLHVGGVRSALFNYLWARHNGGSFVLRIEDTDRARFVDGAEDQIIQSLSALGIDPDESPETNGPYGPYRQSERLEIYRKQADVLVESGDLYPCWCSAERLDGLRQAAQKQGSAFKYDRHCLVPQNKKPDTEAHVLRFKIPTQPESIAWDDAVRGKLEFKLSDLDDFVAIKSDGYPTYQFANVVDDHLMEISHVLRADEWIPSTPKHLLLFEAFDWQVPVYAHLPAVQAPDGRKKLSKRDGAQSVGEYIAEGYLPEALMSFLASLGWNDGTTQEVYTPEELVERFSLDRVQKSPARFDKDRLTWINGYLIRQMPVTDLDRRAQGFWPQAASNFDEPYRLAVLGLTQERLKFLGELAELTEFFFVTPPADAAVITKGCDAATAVKMIEAVLVATERCPWNATDLEHAVRALVPETGVKAGTFFGVLRAAATGRTAAPGLFDTFALLGQPEIQKRLRQAIIALS